MKKSILIADDHVMVRTILRDFFKSETLELEVYEASDGLEAVNKFADLRPDLVVLDLSMPRLNGVEAARKIRELNSTVPILMFTMRADEIPATAVTSSLINAVIMKPDLKSLQQQVEFFLKQNS